MCESCIIKQRVQRVHYHELFYFQLYYIGFEQSYRAVIHHNSSNVPDKIYHASTSLFVKMGCILRPLLCILTPSLKFKISFAALVAVYIRNDAPHSIACMERKPHFFKCSNNSKLF